MMDSEILVQYEKIMIQTTQSLADAKHLGNEMLSYLLSMVADEVTARMTGRGFKPKARLVFDSIGDDPDSSSPVG